MNETERVYSRVLLLSLLKYNRSGPQHQCRLIPESSDEERTVWLAEKNGEKICKGLSYNSFR